MSGGIDWTAYYQEEPRVCDFDPDLDPAEMHRCMAAWSVFPSGKVESILDVGCGDGFFCRWISRKTRARRVVGADISAGRLARARSRYPEIEYVRGEIPCLPFRDGEFDLVSCIEVLEHLADPVEALRELARVARRHLVVTVPYRQVPRQAICPHCLMSFPTDGHLHAFDESKIQEIALAAGMSAERVRGYSLTVGNARIALPWPLGNVAGWILERVKKKRPGTFLAARMRKARHEA